MSRRHELQRRVRALSEIAEIMHSMRTLSLMEARKLMRVLETQHAVVSTIRAAAADLLAFHPLARPRPLSHRDVLLALGSERGFCGDFNAGIRHHLEQRLSPDADAPRSLIVVGSRLAAGLSFPGIEVENLAGASTVEEVPEVVQRVLRACATSIVGDDPLEVSVMHRAGAVGEIRETVLAPAFSDIEIEPTARRGTPPCLYLEPGALLIRLGAEYLSMRLYELVYESLLQEQQQRVRHLDSATRRLDEALGGLTRLNNALRQEEITEELEVILAGADLVGANGDSAEGVSGLR
ncbi:MAG: FoF1 ATP synthase subunit gamma [Methylotetracoccus sp.]